MRLRIPTPSRLAQIPKNPRASATRRILLPVALACVAWLGAARPAAAYVLPADFLCRLVADSRKASLKDAQLTLAIEGAEGETPREERLYLKRPERLRLVGPGDEGPRTVVREGQEASFVRGAMQGRGPARNLLPVLWLPRGRDLDESSARMLEALTAVGVDTSVVSLGRHPDGFAYIIGARSWEPARPQVWIDKASFMPVRVRLPAVAAVGTAPASGPMHEVRLLNYSAGLPRLIEEYDDDKLVRRAEVVQTSVNQSLPESLFDLTGRPARP